MLSYPPMPRIALLAFAVFVAGVIARAQRLDGAERDKETCKAGLKWQPYSTKKLNDNAAKGRVVLIWVRADWCASCQAAEKTTMAAGDVIDAIQKNAVIPLRLDITNQQKLPGAPKWLETKETPRLYVVGPNQHRIVIIRGLVKSEELIATLKFVGESKNAANKE